MGWVTKEQLERARAFPVLDYILRHESSEYKPVGRGYRLRSDDAFAVDNNGWYCHRRCTGSKTALDYLVTIKGYGLVEAVCYLLGESPHEHPDRANSFASSNRKKVVKLKKITPSSRPPPAANNVSKSIQSANPPFAPDSKIPLATGNEPPKPSSISLPIRNKDNKRVIAYLQSRGIDRDLIMDCIERGVLFESKHYHNVVFLGKDMYGKTRFAAMRSVTAHFMQDAEGSDKRFGFAIPPDNPKSSQVAVFESPIDCLSHQTLCKHGHVPPYDGWRLSLGCVSLAALEYFLPRHPEVTHCIICTDNDEAGDMAAAKIANIWGITSERSPPFYGKDWNDALQAAKKLERKRKLAGQVASRH